MRFSLATWPLFQLEIASMSRWPIVLSLQDDEDYSAHDRDGVERQVKKVSDNGVWCKLGEWLLYHLA